MTKTKKKEIAESQEKIAKQSWKQLKEARIMKKDKALTKYKRKKTPVILDKRQLPVLLGAKEVRELAKMIGTSVEKTKKLLVDDGYYREWAKKTDKVRFLKYQAFVSKAMSRLQGQMSKASFDALARAAGIMSDKTTEMIKPAGGLTQINIEGGAKVRFTGWKKAPYGKKQKVEEGEVVESTLKPRAKSIKKEKS